MLLHIFFDLQRPHIILQSHPILTSKRNSRITLLHIPLRMCLYLRFGICHRLLSSLSFVVQMWVEEIGSFFHHLIIYSLHRTSQITRVFFDIRGTFYVYVVVFAATRISRLFAGVLDVVWLLDEILVFHFAILIYHHCVEDGVVCFSLPRGREPVLRHIHVAFLGAGDCLAHPRIVLSVYVGIFDSIINRRIHWELYVWVEWSFPSDIWLLRWEGNVNSLASSLSKYFTSFLLW